MLDVHPPEHPAHSWRDFFIHMGTICLGLLIAIGLEQLVEYLHRRHEVRETIHALNEETEVNRKALYADALWVRTQEAVIRNDALVLEYLKAHPGTPDGQLPGTLEYGGGFVPGTNTAWQAAQQAQLVRYLPPSMISETTERQTLFDGAASSWRAHWNCMESLARPLFYDGSLAHLTPVQIDAELSLLAECHQENMETAAWVFDIQQLPAYASRPYLADADMAAGYRSLQPVPKDQSAPARAQTRQRLQAQLQSAADATKNADP